MTRSSQYPLVMPGMCTPNDTYMISCNYKVVIHNVNCHCLHVGLRFLDSYTYRCRPANDLVTTQCVARRFSGTVRLLRQF